MNSNTKKDKTMSRYFERVSMARFNSDGICAPSGEIHKVDSDLPQSFKDSAHAVKVSHELDKYSNPQEHTAYGYGTSYVEVMNSENGWDYV